jgi:hypothetical protein
MEKHKDNEQNRDKTNKDNNEKTNNTEDKDNKLNTDYKEVKKDNIEQNNQIMQLAVK